MIAILTKYIGATNTHGSRIKAYTMGMGSIKGFTCTVPVDHSLNEERRHFVAVKALIEKHKLDWDTADMRYGDNSSGKGYSFCFANSIIGV